MPIIGVIDSAKSGHLWPANSYYQIANFTVGAGGGSSVSFTSIPATYTHLQIRALQRTTQSSVNGTSILLRMNGSASSDYSDQTLRTYFGSGTGLDAFANANTTFINVGAATSGSLLSNLFTGTIIDILDYANTNKFKTTRSLNGYDFNGETNGYSYIQYVGGLFRSTAAISSISLTCDAGNYAQYTSIALYGIKV